MDYYDLFLIFVVNTKKIMRTFEKGDKVKDIMIGDKQTLIDMWLVILLASVLVAQTLVTGYNFLISFKL